MSLACELSQFTGTEQWYQHPLMPSVTYTDGVQYFAEKAGAYWLLDILATEVAPLLKTEDFIKVVVSVKNEKAGIAADDGNGNVLWSRGISYTDCPDGDWSFYVLPGGPGMTSVILLPSEY